MFPTRCRQHCVLFLPILDAIIFFSFKNLTLPKKCQNGPCFSAVVRDQWIVDLPGFVEVKIILFIAYNQPFLERINCGKIFAYPVNTKQTRLSLKLYGAKGPAYSPLFCSIIIAACLNLAGRICLKIERIYYYSRLLFVYCGISILC